MDVYFTVMVKENDTSNLKLLTEKLNDGFHTTESITVGKSTVIVLRKRERDRRYDQLNAAVGGISLPVNLGSGNGFSYAETTNSISEDI